MTDSSIYNYRQAVAELVTVGAISAEHGAWLMAEFPVWPARRTTDYALDESATAEDQPVVADDGPGLP